MSLLLFTLAYWRHLNLFKCCVCASKQILYMSKQTGETTPTLVPPVCSALCIHCGPINCVHIPVRENLLLVGCGDALQVLQTNMDSFQARDKTWLGVEALLRDLLNLIDDLDSADVLFLVGQDEVAVYAHRLMLVARCKHFRNRQRELWSSKSVHSQLTVRKPDFRPDVFREVLTFVYTGKVTMP